ncbi:MAG: hypothetical protein ACRDCA_03555 [Serratia sp. (in: enterobacteria)]|uniref:hypothetical protein n=1 Tax=Serratia sp. (in: enterobacteria) TaxID=616 RepID=UPI003F3264B6
MRKITSMLIISTTLLFTASSFAVPGKPYGGQQGWGSGPRCCQSYDCPMQGARSGGFLSTLPYPARQEYHLLIAADHFDKSKFSAFFDKYEMKNKDALFEWSYQHYEWFHQLP